MKCPRVERCPHERNAEGAKERSTPAPVGCQIVRISRIAGPYISTERRSAAHWRRPDAWCMLQGEVVWL